MKLKSLAAGTALAVASLAAFAADQDVAVSTAAVAHFNGTTTLFDGGSDDITFSGLVSGLYNITVTLSGQNISFTGNSGSVAVAA